MRMHPGGALGMGGKYLLFKLRNHDRNPDTTVAIKLTQTF